MRNSLDKLARLKSAVARGRVHQFPTRDLCSKEAVREWNARMLPGSKYRKVSSGGYRGMLRVSALAAKAADKRGGLGAAKRCLTREPVAYWPQEGLLGE